MVYFVQYSNDDPNTFLGKHVVLQTCLKAFDSLYIEKLKKIVRSPWFYGFMLPNVSKQFLEVEIVGSFLVRCSTTLAFTFEIEYVATPFFSNTMSVSSTSKGFEVKDGNEKKYFQEFQVILNYWQKLFNTPFTSPLPKMKFFYAEIDSDKASELLKGKPVGTFLFRFSSNSGCFALSYVSRSGGILKGLITRTGDYKFKVEGENLVYDTMDKLIDSFVNSGVFYKPLNKDEL